MEENKNEEIKEEKVEEVVNEQSQIENNNVEENKKCKSNKLFVIIIVIIAMALTFGCGIMLGKELFESKKDTKKENEIVDDKKEDNNSSIEKEVQSVSLSKEEINKLLEFLPVVSLSGSNDYSVYQSKTVYPKNIDISILIENVLNNVNHLECTVELFNANGICDYVVNVNDVKNEIRKRYNVDNYSLPSEINGSGLLHCTLVNDLYSCSNSGGGWISNNYTDYFGITYNYNASFSSNITSYLKAEKDMDNLYVYEEVVNCRFDYINDNDNDYNNINNYRFKLYKYSDTNDLLINDYLEGKDFYEEGGFYKTFKTKVLDYVKDNYTTYKHTFKINSDGTYTWIKTEPIN